MLSGNKKWGKQFRISGRIREEGMRGFNSMDARKEMAKLRVAAHIFQARCLKHPFYR